MFIHFKGVFNSLHAYSGNISAIVFKNQVGAVLDVWERWYVFGFVTTRRPDNVGLSLHRMFRIAYEITLRVRGLLNDPQTNRRTHFRLRPSQKRRSRSLKIRLCQVSSLLGSNLHSSL